MVKTLLQGILVLEVFTALDLLISYLGFIQIIILQLVLFVVAYIWNKEMFNSRGWVESRVAQS